MDDSNAMVPTDEAIRTHPEFKADHLEMLDGMIAVVSSRAELIPVLDGATTRDDAVARLIARFDLSAAAAEHVLDLRLDELSARGLAKLHARRDRVAGL